MPHQIRLIVGLGNPGGEYENTRHNAGAWLIEQLLKNTSIALKPEKKFKGLFAKAKLFDQECFILAPTTYMNLSGESVIAVANFYKILPEEILIAHDDLDLLPGIVRLKKDGGHGGHNGLQNIIQHLKTKDFYRIRIGIGHPGNKDQVSDYVLKKPKKDELEKIEDAITRAENIMPDVMSGNLHTAMQTLHTEESE